MAIRYRRNDWFWKIDKSVLAFSDGWIVVFNANKNTSQTVYSGFFWTNEDSPSLVFWDRTYSNLWTWMISWANATILDFTWFNPVSGDISTTVKTRFVDDFPMWPFHTKTTDWKWLIGLWRVDISQNYPACALIFYKLSSAFAIENTVDYWKASNLYWSWTGFYANKEWKNIRNSWGNNWSSYQSNLWFFTNETYTSWVHMDSSNYQNWSMVLTSIDRSWVLAGNNWWDTSQATIWKTTGNAYNAIWHFWNYWFAGNGAIVTNTNWTYWLMPSNLWLIQINMSTNATSYYAIANSVINSNFDHFNGSVMSTYLVSNTVLDIWFNIVLNTDNTISYDKVQVTCSESTQYASAQIAQYPSYDILTFWPDIIFLAKWTLNKITSTLVIGNLTFTAKTSHVMNTWLTALWLSGKSVSWYNASSWANGKTTSANNLTATKTSYTF